jgi:hypothetical protein
MPVAIVDDSYEAKVLDRDHDLCHLLQYLLVVMCLVHPHDGSAGSPKFAT